MMKSKKSETKNNQSHSTNFVLFSSLIFYRKENESYKQAIPHSRRSLWFWAVFAINDNPHLLGPSKEGGKPRQLLKPTPTI